MTNVPANKPLDGVRVLDLSRILAGPFATQTLADLGANVIKVEHPERGDDTRHWGPPFVAASDGSRGNSAYFYCANRNKTFLNIDFKTDAGRDRILALVRETDVLVENYKVDSLAKYGLDYDSLKTVNPRLIYCSITGFGQTGPYRYRPGYDFIIQGMSGFMSLTGTPDNLPGGGPVRAGVAVSDLSAGLQAVTGILSALYRREATGLGCHIDIALLDVQISMLANQASNYLNGGVVPTRIGNTHPNIVPYQVFQTSDTPIIIAVGNDSQWVRFCKAIDKASLAHDKRFATNKGRVEAREELVSLLEEVLAQRSSTYWLNVFNKRLIPAGPVNDLDQVFRDPQVIARNLCEDIATDTAEKVRGVTNPIVFRD